MNAHDRGAYVLSCRDNKGKGQESHDRDSVMESKHGAIRVITVNFDETLEAQE
uniref:Uncharacterized protein n=1 Tax=Lepeophtheirus salmonis TaxID=72036 RepID=A0A0K2UFZ8_LEPSM